MPLSGLESLPTDAFIILLRLLRPSDIIVLRLTSRLFTTLPMLSDEVDTTREDSLPEWKIPRYLFEERLLAHRRYEFDFYLRAKAPALEIVEQEEEKLRVVWEEEERQWRIEYDRIKLENEALEAEQQRIKLEEEEMSIKMEDQDEATFPTQSLLNTQVFQPADSQIFTSSSPPASSFFDELDDADFFAAEESGEADYSDFSPRAARYENYDRDMTPPSSPPVSPSLRPASMMADPDASTSPQQLPQPLPSPPPPPPKLDFNSYIDVSVTTAGLTHLVCNKCGHILPVSHPHGFSDGASNISINSMRKRECIACRVHRFPNLRVANTFLTTVSNVPVFACFLCKTAQPFEEDGYKLWSSLEQAEIEETLVKGAMIVKHKFCRSCFENRTQLEKPEDESYEELIRMLERKFPKLGKLGATEEERKKVQEEERREAEAEMKEELRDLARKKAAANAAAAKMAIDEPADQSEQSEQSKKSEQSVLGKCITAATNLVRGFFGANQSTRSTDQAEHHTDDDDDEFDADAPSDVDMIAAAEQQDLPSDDVAMTESSERQQDNTSEDIEMSAVQEAVEPENPYLKYRF